MVSCVYASMLSREGLSMNSCVHVGDLDRTRSWRGILKSGDSADIYYPSYRPWKNTISKQMCIQPSLAFVLTLSTSTHLRIIILWIIAIYLSSNCESWRVFFPRLSYMQLILSILGNIKPYTYSFPLDEGRKIHVLLYVDPGFKFICLTWSTYKN